MAGLFPEAGNLREYWENIIRKKDCLRDVPASRWSIEDYYDPHPDTPDKTYCKRGGFIPEVEFDPLEFGLPPNILEVTDVSQLLALVVARAALKDAGYGQASEAVRERTGVILGIGGGQKLITPLTSRLQYPVLEKVLRSSGVTNPQPIVEKFKQAYIPWEENSFPGMLGNVIAGRVANRLDLGGINCVVDAACASSLSALKMAISELVERRCDMMITGGVDTDNSIFMYMCFSKTPAFSKQQQVRPFDAESDGMMVGEGLGMLVLKRLSDAEQAGDRIYAVIRGIGTSSDGRYRSIYAPRASGQALALRRAYADAGYAPSSVGLIEAHGTGTLAGDPTEFAALKIVFGENNERKQYIALGSVKSQIGHTKATAGAASLIKATLSLHHKILPPTLNVTRPHPNLGIEDSPFYLNTEPRPWLRTDVDPPRRAGVSSFGFGGTNFHVTLEEYQPEHGPAYRLHTTAQVILLVAETPGELLARCQDSLQALQGEAGQGHFATLTAASRTLAPDPFAARLGFVAESPAEAAGCLQVALESLQNRLEAESWEHPKGVYYRRAGFEPGAKVVALFPGQGAQYLDMGRELSNNFPLLRQSYSQMDGLFKAEGLAPLSRIVFPIPAFTPSEQEAQAKTLERTEYAQSAIGVFSFGLFKLLQQAGFQADMVAGHSFGELTALWAAGALTDADFLFLAKARGQAMATPDRPGFEAGAMLAVKGDAWQLRQVLDDLAAVTVANFNSNQQTVLAGATAAVRQAQQLVEARGYSTVLLPVSAAFHTPFVRHAQQPFAQALERVSFHSPRLPVYANSLAHPYVSDPTAMRQTLAEQMLKPVLFQQQIENIYLAGGQIFVEIGPKGILTPLVKEILRDRPHLAVATNSGSKKDSDRQLREAIVQLRVAGLPLKDFDPHLLEPDVSEIKPKQKLTVRLNGSNYVSEKTKMAFENALKNGNQTNPSHQETKNLATSHPIFPSPSNGNAALASLTMPVAEPTPASLPAEQPPQSLPVASQREHFFPGESSRILASLEQIFSQLSGLQSEVLRVHEQYLQSQAGYTQAFFQLTQQQTTLLNTQFATPEQVQLVTTVSQNLTTSMLRFHDHQAETLRVHEQYLQQQMANFKLLAHLAQQQYNLIALGAPPVIDPVTPLAPDVPVNLPPAPPVAPVELPQACTFVAPVATPAPAIVPSLLPVIVPAPPPSAPPPPLPPQPPVTPQPAPPVPLPTASAPEVDFALLSGVLLEVVSDKTGYPTEMLELEMDIEADLGIDSIKRVEIMGAMQSRFPELPRLKPEELAELRTLSQIVAHAEQQLRQGQSSQNGTSPSARPQLQHRQVWLKPLPLPDALEVELPPNYSCLITDDGGPTGLALARRLLLRGWRVVMLNFPPKVVPSQLGFSPEIERVALQDMSEAHLQQQLTTITDEYGPIGAFIHLNPGRTNLSGGNGSLSFPEAEEAIVKHVFLIAKYLSSSLQMAAGQGRSCFLSVARLDGQFGLGGGGEFSPVGGGLFGLTKSLKLEWPSVFCRALDLSPDLGSDEAVQIMLAELYDPNRLISEVGYSPSLGRVTLVAQETAL